MRIYLRKNKRVFFISLTIFIGSTALCGFCLNKAKHEATAASILNKEEDYSRKFLELDNLRQNFKLSKVTSKEYNSLKNEFIVAIGNLDFPTCDSLLKDIHTFIKSATKEYFNPLRNTFEFYYNRPFNNLSSEELTQLKDLKNNFYKACDSLNLSLAEKLSKEAKDFIIKNNKEGLQKKYKGIDLADPTRLKSPIYIDDILLVNKDYALPSTYNPGNKTEALEAFNQMKLAARKDGIYIDVGSSYRSYNNQVSLFNNYAKKQGIEKANTFSAKPGHSEHQSGLTFDIVGASNSSAEINSKFNNTKEAKWLEENAHNYGFILRFPKDKEHITGYIYESWHYRYIGTTHSKHFNNNNLTLEEYLGIA